MTTATDDRAFPEQLARTRGLQLGVPRSFTVSADRAVFLRSKGGDDPLTCLWVLDLGSGEERCVVDPRDLKDGSSGGGELTEAERARRERARERAGGVVAYATDDAVGRAVFALAGRLFVVELGGGEVRELAVPGVPFDPRLSPDGSRVAYVVDGALHVQDVDGDARVLSSDPDPDVHWGIAEFIAAEEMDRSRGYWWSPDGTKIAAARVDERPVLRWWISDPSMPDASPLAVRYPQAGTANAEVTLYVIDVATGDASEVRWDHDGFEYLARVVWSSGSPLTLVVQSRDQRTVEVLEVDESTGGTSAAVRDEDAVWVDLVAGSPKRLPDGRLASTANGDDRRRVRIDGDVVSPSSLHVRALLGGGEDGVWFAASPEDPMDTHVFQVDAGGEVHQVTTDPGAHGAIVADGVAAIHSRAADADGPAVWVRTKDGSRIDVDSFGEEPLVDPMPQYATLGERDLRAALLLPGGREPGAGLPVLLSPYGGPGWQRVVRHRGDYVVEQWFADRLGAAVLVIDGRGTPGRSVSWEHAVHLDFSVTLQDQVDGLQAAASRWGFLDLERVAIRGWSFGGMLSALAACTRPDVFHAAVAGAPVSDQRLYDTHYTERYLGHPDEQPEAYRRSSPLPFASNLRRPLLMIHGFADDNVVVANALRMTDALNLAAIPHELVLIPRASHMGGSDDVVVSRYLIELDFLRRSLG
ncbi:MAG TPA: DPP IV N-terminal domain-containing protein, partial [Actinomycetota bacterium]|nr:DPP IV N-terminal domain-containing protein [Actinomycetota bacterium]